MILYLANYTKPSVDHSRDLRIPRRCSSQNQPNDCDRERDNRAGVKYPIRHFPLPQNLRFGSGLSFSMMVKIG